MKTINAPVFHVNAQSIEDVCYVFKLAAEFRQKFEKDVVIDLIGYRKFGHNELDQPSFTQPLMYKQVAKMNPVARDYEKWLLENGHTTQGAIDEKKNVINSLMENAYTKSKSLTYDAEDWETEEWGKIKIFDKKEAAISGMKLDELKEIGNKISSLP